jgi:hypothetical protein
MADKDDLLIHNYHSYSLDNACSRFNTCAKLPEIINVNGNRMPALQIVRLNSGRYEHGLIQNESVADYIKSVAYCLLIVNLVALLPEKYKPPL